MPEGMGRTFLVQWHPTHRCEQKCLHCYISNGQCKELSLKECIGVLEDIHRTVVEEFGRKLKINFSGGDPLLREDFFDLARAAKRLSVGIGILGNPHLITGEMAEKLCKLNLEAYQVSIDGTKEIHDSIRGNGSFEKTISAIRILNEYGIPTHVMATIGRYNAAELPEIVRICVANRVGLFGFDFFVPNGPKDLDQLLEPAEIKSLMYEYRELTRKLSLSYPTKFAEKNNLFTLLDRNTGTESPLAVRSKTATKICAGCSVGVNLLSILPDGTVYPCRRLPIEIGKFPEQTLEEVFFGETMEALRHEESKPEKEIEKCGRCDLFYVCRGCRAMAYAANGNYFAPDPSCWKK